MQESLDSYKHSSLLGLLVSFKENEMPWIRYQGEYSQYFIFILTYELAQ